jgi:peptidoglycan/LPS O-acetylase OafA/YrhL
MNAYLYNRSYNILNFLAGPLIVAPILMNNALSHFFSTRIPVYLGKISFAAYLTHLLVIYVVGLPLFNYIFDSSLDISYTATAMIPIVVVIICTILFSELYYRLVDKKTIQFSGFLSDLILKRK